MAKKIAQSSLSVLHFMARILLFQFFQREITLGVTQIWMYASKFIYILRNNIYSYPMLSFKKYVTEVIY